MIDLHTHTTRCGHAEGKLEQYILAAIDCNLKEYGISDHFPMDYLGFREEDMSSMYFNELSQYIKEVENLKEKSRDKIFIKLGLEIDYVQGLEIKTSELIKEKDLDYVIGSIHFLFGKDVSHPKNKDYFKTRPLIDIYHDYFKKVENMVNSDNFDIIGHIDVIKKHGHVPSESLQEFYIELSKLLSRKNQVVEINTGGLRAPVEEMYPSFNFLQELVSHNVPLTLGSDAHKPSEVAYGFPKVYSILKQLGVSKLVTFNQRVPYEIFF
ncbi:histidinol-phosphatase [Natranaerobius trueperi]|uniref:histidinol-phosphatase n=1 Tax=Natranaerobius trueperi TaxID=759412 RepID=UPI001303D2CF|nr:histidinol-phosphatase [Natranaerobius trueperi]